MLPFCAQMFMAWICNWLFACSENFWIAFFQFLKPTLTKAGLHLLANVDWFKKTLAQWKHMTPCKVALLCNQGKVVNHFCWKDNTQLARFCTTINLGSGCAGDDVWNIKSLSVPVVGVRLVPDMGLNILCLNMTWKRVTLWNNNPIECIVHINITFHR